MKFKNLFNNWKLKLLSVALAILAWVIILGFLDPTSTRTIPNVPITITNDDIFSEAGKSYTVDGRLYTSVKVTGPNSIVRNLTAGDFTATADLAQMYDVTGQVPISLTCTARGASSITYSLVTASLKIKIEDVLTKRFEVQIDTSGDLADGYLIGSVKANPAYITVQAPESVIERIAEARVSIELKDLTDNTVFTCTPVFYSTVGAELDLSTARETVVSHDEVQVEVEILTMKTVPVVINVGGKDEVAQGYRYTGAQQSVSAVNVSGLRSRLAVLTSVTIPETDLSVAGASRDLTIEIALSQYLPEGIELVDGEETVLTVVLQVAPLTLKTFEVNNIKLVGQKTNLEYTFLNAPLRIQLRALEEDFKGITEEDIAAALDVNGYGPGEYSLPVQVEVDETVFEVVGTPYLKLSIVDPNAKEPTEEETKDIQE